MYCPPDNLSAFLAAVYLPHRLSVSDSTAAQYGYALRSLERHAGRPLKISELSESLVLPWLRARLKEVSPRTVKRERGDVLTIWRWAHKHGYTSLPPPDIPPIRLPRRVPVAWTLDEYERVVATCRSLRGNMRGTGISRSAWWSSLMIFLYWSGARISAALQVRSADVSMLRRLVVLRADSSKTGEEQVVHLHDQAVAAIAGHFDLARELVWPYPYGRRQKFIQLKAILRTAGLPNGRERMFHCVRRTCYTLTYRFGGRAMASAQLGHHTDMSEHYLDTSQLEEQTAADVLPPLDLN